MTTVYTPPRASSTTVLPAATLMYAFSEGGRSRWAPPRLALSAEALWSAWPDGRVEGIVMTPGTIELNHPDQE
ncbi:hypothetical protein GCM10027456_67320 [Kineosporia babensis]